MSVIRYALFSNGENIYKDNRTFKSKSYAVKKLMFHKKWEYLTNTVINVEIKEVEVDSDEDKIKQLEQQLSKTQSYLKLAVDGLCFYANADNWMSDADSSPDFYDCIDSDFEECNEDGYKFSCGGKFARQTLKQIRGNKDEN